MKTVLNVALAALMLTSTLAQAGCVPEDRGSPHADGHPGWTRKIITQQANNNWQDWIWRGQSEGQTFHCPWNNGKPECDYMWGQSRTREWSWGVGGGVLPGGYPQDWFKKAFGSLIFNFSADYRQSRSTTQTFNISASARRGQFIEPIIVVQRRWSRGYFQGGWMQTRSFKGMGRDPRWFFCYDFDWNRAFGAWETHLKVTEPYRTYHIHW